MYNSVRGSGIGVVRERVKLPRGPTSDMAVVKCRERGGRDGGWKRGDRERGLHGLGWTGRGENAVVRVGDG